MGRETEAKHSLEAVDMGSLVTSRYALGAIAGAILGVWGQGAAAQEQASAPCSNQVTDWSVCVAEAPKECWAVSTAKESVNTKEGRVVAVRRSDILSRAAMSV